MSVFEKLINLLPSYFDKRSEPIKLFKIPDSTVAVNLESRTFGITKSNTFHEIDISNKTIEQLISELTTRGFTVDIYTTSYNKLFCLTLVNRTDNMGIVYFENNYILRLLRAIAWHTEDEQNNWNNSLRQAYFYKSQDFWLDLWGAYFGFTRESGENDAQFFTRIMFEILFPKLNNRALEKFIQFTTNINSSVEDLGLYSRDILCTNYYPHKTNNANCVLFDGDTMLGILNNTFLVKLFVTSGLSNELKQRIRLILNKAKAIGTHWRVFIPFSGVLHTNTDGEISNSVDFLVSPGVKTWTEVEI